MPLGELNQTSSRLLSGAVEMLKGGRMFSMCPVQVRLPLHLSGRAEDDERSKSEHARDGQRVSCMSRKNPSQTDRPSVQVSDRALARTGQTPTGKNARLTLPARPALPKPAGRSGAGTLEREAATYQCCMESRAFRSLPSNQDPVLHSHAPVHHKVYLRVR